MVSSGPKKDHNEKSVQHLKQHLHTHYSPPGSLTSHSPLPRTTNNLKPNLHHNPPLLEHSIARSTRFRTAFTKTSKHLSPPCDRMLGYSSSDNVL
ncbi:hypothetical protein HBI70_054720 [Parastagonospora nodorum]|nr:hypothetical protein HBI70_054720 [Parastagonospora nodorum]KAH5457012.1 hypothetical protein HBI30_071080 [Parastagonospora nodorum]